MAKIKNKKKNLAEHISNKKKSQHVKTLNPFEVHINREKMKVLGRKLKNDRGLPGVSRAKALKKRKNTLLQEYKLQNKSNQFLDKRIGERNAGLTEEDRAMARFTAVRTRAHKRKSIFNLADDEVLTHRGQTLNEIEKFDDPRSDDEESLDGQTSSGKLDTDFVEDAHFGGGILSRTGTDGAKSHKDLINQLIAESKKRKAEKQKTKEKTLELTEKLDTEWKDLIPIVNKSVKQPGDNPKPEVDDYDKVIRELRFEARGTPSDRLKTEDEIAKEEKDKLEKLENERLARMKGFFEEKTPSTSKHRGADDLDDDFAYDSDPDIMLSYNEMGESNVILKENTEVEENDKIEESEVEESDDEAETASEDDLSDLKEESSDSEREEEVTSDKNESEDEESEEKENINSDEGNLEHEVTESKQKVAVISIKTQKDVPVSDLKAGRCTENTKTIENIPVSDLQRKRSTENSEELLEKKQKLESNTNETEKIKADLLIRKDMMEKARQELPYTFNLPDSYEDLQKVFTNQSPIYQSVIIERMIKCNHPSLGEGNKDKLGMLFVYLLQYINDIASDDNIKECFKVFNCLVPQLFDLAQLNQDNAQNSVMEVIKEKHMEYRKNKKEYPTLDVLLFLKIVSCLFPTSDFRHPVVTPSIVFIDQMLYKCRVRTEGDIAYGLFLVALFIEYTSLSRRYLPAAISYLAGILHMTIPKSGVKLMKVLPPFKSTSSSLVLFKNCCNLNMSLKLETTDLVCTEITEDFKIRALYTSLKLLQEFKENFKELSSIYEIFEPIIKYLQHVPVSNYPQEVQIEIKSTLEDLNRLKTERSLDYIVMAARKPKALRLYEPNIQKVYDHKKHRVMSKEKAAREKMLHKLKREKKGALREIRKDKAFLGRIKINQKIQSDQQRKEKVKQIYAEASIQQSELNSLDRKKKRKT